jgi:hypothetical protein
MKPETTPSFSFERKDKVIICWFNNHPQKSNEGKQQWLAFKRECNSELEAILLHDYLREFEHLIHKEYFTRGFDAHKKKDKNWYL